MYDTGVLSLDDDRLISYDDINFGFDSWKVRLLVFCVNVHLSICWFIYVRCSSISW